jgi:transcription elongation factor GreA
MTKIPMTREGFQKLEQELKDMRGRQLREHIQNLSDAKDNGDLSENAEYDIAKTALDDLNRKINKLSQKLANVEIIEGIVDDGTVQLLTWVKFRNTKSQIETEYRIVPESEIDIKANKISYLSPIGSALMGKKVGEKVIAQVPIGKMELEIIDINIKK